MGLIPRKRLFLACLPAIAAIVFLFSCALQNPQSPADPTGSVAPKILFRAAVSQVDFDERIKPSLDSVKISALSGGKLVEGKFPYAAHAGKLSNVPAGDAVVDVKALDKSGVIVVAGQLTITVESGRTAEPVVNVGPQDAARPYLSPVLAVSGAVQLSWVIWNRASLPGSAQIKIERRIGTGGFTQIALVPLMADGFADSVVLAKNVPHVYQIKIVDGASVVVSNQQSIVSTDGGVILAAPDGLNHAFEGTGNQVRLNWNYGDETAITGYEIERSPQTTPRTWSLAGTATKGTRTFLDAAVTPGQSYVYRVRSTAGGVSYSVWSSEHSLVVPTGGSGSCPADMALNSGYCIDRREFGSVLPAQPRGIDNITFTAAKDSCIAHGKALCDVFEWNDACQKSQTGQPLAGTVYDMSGGGANDEEWCVGTTVSGPHFGDNACATHSATVAAQPNRGFRCCKMPQ